MMTDNQIIREGIKIFRKHLRLNEHDSRLDDIPIDCGFFEKIIDKIPYLKLKYFGKCNDSYVVNKVFGDATTMSDFVNSCSIISGSAASDKIIDVVDGEHKIPSSFQKIYSNLVINQELEDFDKIVFGINTYQKIAFIYLGLTDIHYFFDVE